MVPMGLAEATTVRVGHALGRSDLAGVRRAAGAGIAIALGTQLVSGIALLLGNDTIVGFYTDDAAVAALAAAIVAAVREHVWPLLADGRVRPVVSSRHALADASTAHAEMEASGHIGKILLVAR